MSLVAHKYTPAEMSPEELQATFAARGHTVDYLLKSLREQIKSGTLSSYVLTGPRGSGKSTIIQMVALRIRQDPKLQAAWIAVVFPEEQFNIASLRDLMAATLDNLVKQGISPAKHWLEKVEAEANEEQSLQLAMTGLREITRKQGKRLILFIENLNQMMEECLDDQMKGTFRRLLMSDPFMMVIGSAVHVFDSLKNYDEAFFNYFGQVSLDRLTAEEAFELLRLRAEFDGNLEFLKKLPSYQSKVRTIVLLSGGNPRFILMLYELLSQRQITTIVQCLRRLVDELTPLLKHEIENLPPQQRLIIHALMERGGAAQPTDLVAQTRLPLNAITTQLGRLKEAQFVELLGGGKGRMANYTVPDKLFAVWYQVRYLNQNRRRIEMFVEVLRVWFEEDERLVTLRNLASTEQGGAAHVLRDAAVTGEYFAASLKGTKHERLAVGLCIDHWAKADFLGEAAIAYADLSNKDKKNCDLDEIQAYAGIGDLLFQHGDYRRAIQSLDKVIANNPMDFVALSKRGIAKIQLSEIQGAILDFNSIIEMKSAPDKLVALVLGTRGIAKATLMDIHGAISDYNTMIALKGSPKKFIALILVNRGDAKGELNDIQGAILDYTTVIVMKDAPNEEIARALLSRGLAKYQSSDVQGAIFDFTSTIEIKNAPRERIGQALVGRSVIKAHVDDIKTAISDYTAVIEMGGVSKEHVARALFHRGVAKCALGEMKGAISDYTSLIELENASTEGIAYALFNRGFIKVQLGDFQGGICDYSSLIEMKGAPPDGVARSLFNRGITHVMIGDFKRGVSDFTSVIEIQGLSTEQVASALFNRAVVKAKFGDMHGAVPDFTRVIEMDGASKEQFANALVNRGIAKINLNDKDGAISDFTAVIETNGVSNKQRATALFRRGIISYRDNRIKGAITDLIKVIDLAEMTDDMVIHAANLAFGALWLRKNNSGAKAVVAKFAGLLNAESNGLASTAALRFLNSIASPELQDAWPTALRIISENPAIAEELRYLEPVCAVLEGKERAVLDGLPPEQREFAETVLRRFDPKPI